MPTSQKTTCSSPWLSGPGQLCRSTTAVVCTQLGKPLFPSLWCQGVVMVWGSCKPSFGGPDGWDEHLIIPLPAQHRVFQVFGGSMWTLRKRNKLLETTHGWDLLTQQVLATTRQRALRKAKTLAKKKPFEGRLSEESFQVTADAFSISFSPLSQPGSSSFTGRLGRLPVFTSP